MRSVDGHMHNKSVFGSKYSFIVLTSADMHAASIVAKWNRRIHGECSSCRDRKHRISHYNKGTALSCGSPSDRCQSKPLTLLQ